MIDDFTDAIVSLTRHFGVLERDTVCCGDVTVQQCVALQRLQRGPTGVSELADYLGKSVSATTRLVDGLQRRKWVDRQSDPDDGRRIQIILTDAGTDQARELRESTEDIAATLLDFIPDEQHRNITEALSLLENAIAKCRRQCCNSGCCET